MKLTQIALALAAISAAPAFAINIITQAPAVPAGNIIYISGASALSGTVGGVVTSLCAGTVAKYVDTKDGKQDAAYKCSSAAAGAGFIAGTPYIVVKRDEDGSFAGVGPVAIPGSNATNSLYTAGGLNFMDLTNCPTAPVGATPGTCTYIAPGAAATSKVIPHAGLSDVETTIWQARGQFNPDNGVSIAPNFGFAAQGFGVAVTEVLYADLQRKQFGVTSPCVGNLAPGACQPSISRDQYTSIVSKSGGYHTDWSPIIGAPGVLQAVNLCRRVDTSGTQASSDMYFLSNPCANAKPTFGALTPAANHTLPTVPPTVVNDSVPGQFHVIENSSTGNVKSCLSFHNNGVDNPLTANNEAAEGKYAIGVVSLENATEAGWKFVKLSNVSPNTLSLNGTDRYRQTAIDGEYDFAFEFEALWRNGVAVTPPGGTLGDGMATNPPTPSGLDGFRAGFMTAFVNQLSDPALVDLRGIYVVPGAFTNAGNTSHVGKGTRFGNSCQPFQLFE